jgi:quercetin dioxygenase-like cupin family protein
MRKLIAGGAVGLAVLCTVGVAQEKTTSSHILLTVPELKWGDPPPVFRKGARMAVVSGDPGKAGPFVVRLKMPAGYKVAPHWHPTDEHVTVLSGSFALGMGEKFDAATMKTLPAGGYGLLPAEMRHFAMAKTAATVQVHGTGPFVLNYVNPADDPSKATAK